MDAATLLIAALAVALSLGETPVAVAPYLYYAAVQLMLCNVVSRAYVLKRCILVFAVAVYVVMRAAIPLPEVPTFFVAMYVGAEFTLPFWLCPLLEPLLGELALPVAAVAAEYYHTMTFLYGSFGIFPYTQAGNLPLMQLVSITGVWGLSFLIAWLGGGIGRSLDASRGPEERMRSLMRPAAAYVLVCACGGLRIRYCGWEGASAAAHTRVVRVAGVHAPSTLSTRLQLIAHHLQTVVPEGVEGVLPPRSRRAWADLEAAARADWAAAFNAAKREARAGAQVVMLPELSLVSLEGKGFTRGASTAALFKRAAALATREGIHVGVGLGSVWPWAAPPPSVFGTDIHGAEGNRFVLMGPRSRRREKKKKKKKTGATAVLDYWKSNPVFLIESPFVYPGNSTIPVAEIEIAPHEQPVRVASVICFDMEHPWFTRQLAGHVDLVLNPSFDWPGINPLHARIAAFRAIELGATVVHHCQGGTSLALDPFGAPLATSDFYADARAGGTGTNGPCAPSGHQPCTPPTFVASVPVIGRSTVYGYVGDAFAWVAVAFVGYALLLRVAV